MFDDMISVAEGFERLEKPSRGLAVGSAAGRVVSNALSFPPIFGDIFGFLTQLGLLGRVTGRTGKKITEKQ